jgi:Phage terminase-like protein, large subunit
VTAVDDRLIMGARDPRILVHPESERTAGRVAVDLAFRAGLRLDPWQSLVLERSLGVDADGRWSAFEAGLIVARQNGKSAIFEARCLAGLFLFDEELILYSAHEFKTSAEIFRRVLALIEGTPDLRKRVKAVARSKGEEGIELLPTRACPRGQRLRFVARSTNSGRGFSADCTIWDECQNLPDASVDAMMPTLLARPNPQLWYGGSAPDKELAPCEQITRVRRRALDGPADRLAYFEWSAELCGDQCGPGCEEHDDPADPLTWAKCNPALGSGRVTVEGVAKLHASMSYRGFARELLSVGNYPVEDGGWDVISEAAWQATAASLIYDDAGHVVGADSHPEDPVAFAVDVTPDRSMACIAIAGARSDGLTHLEVVDHEPGTAWVVGRIQGLIAKWKPCAVALDPGGPAGSLVADFEAAGIELTTTKARDVAAACGALYDAVVRPPDAPEGWAPSVRHIPHPALSGALSGAGKRPLGDAWAWDRRGVSVDISPLVAVTLARWAYASRPHEEDDVEPWAAWT